MGAALLAVALAGRANAADVTGAYDGTMSARNRPQVIAAATLLTSGGGVTGTVAMNLADGSAAWLFPVTGTARGGRVTFRGADAANGARLTWKGRATKENLKGRVKVRAANAKLAGPMALSRRTEQTDPPEHCDSSFFTGQVVGRVLNVCAGCHVPGGSAAVTGFRVTSGDPLATQDSVGLQIDKANPGQSRILLKPSGQLPHGGGVRLVQGSEEYGILEQWVNLVASGQQCGGPGDAPMTAMAPGELLIRAAMDLRGKRPTPAELDLVEANPAEYPNIVEGWLHSPEFLGRVKDLYDDALLVRAEDDRDESRTETAAIYGEAAELVAYIVDQERPFTELGTADYTVANALFQRDTRRMPYPMEPVSGDAWQPTHYLDGRPHAGLLSTSAFYRRWDTNSTNVNRRRANRWSIVFHCYNFLDTPVDVTRNVDNNDRDAVLNAVTTRSDCKACHDSLDPLASFLFPTDNANGLEGGNPDSFFASDPDRWRYANKRPPAVYGKPGMDLRDLGRLLVDNPKFAECQTKRAFKMLFLRDPQTATEFTTATEIANHFASDDGFNYRAMVRRWLLSDAYRQRPITNDPAWVRRAAPERYESLLADLTGFVWQRAAEDHENDADPNSDPPRLEPVPLLTSETRDGFRVIMGGIDGDTVTTRSHSLNASVLMLQRKVAALAAEYLMTNDLPKPDSDRRLLHGISGTEDPTDDADAIRAAVAGMARRLYGVRWAPADPHIDPLLTLYGRLWTDRSKLGDERDEVPGTRPQRAWRGVLIALLRSPRMLLY